MLRTGIKKCLESGKAIRCNYVFALRLLLLIFTLYAGSSYAQKNPAVPKTRVENVRETLHGIDLVDPYRWLENQNSDETRSWIDAQNAYTHGLLQKLQGRESVRKRLSELLRADTFGIPIERAGRYFFSKRSADQDLSVLYVRKGLTGTDEVLLDPHSLSSDHTTSIDLLDISQDGTLAAYGVREGGADEFEVRLINVDSRQMSPPELSRGRYLGISISSDKKGIYYSRHTREGSRVYFHSMGNSQNSDAEIFGRGYGPEEIISCELSEEGKFLVATIYYGSAAKKTEVYVQDLASAGHWNPIVKDIDARFLPKIAEDSLYLHTNWNAPNGRILKVDLKNSSQDRWEEIVQERDAAITDFTPACQRIFVNFLKDVRFRCEVFSSRGKFLYGIDPPTLGTIEGITGRWKSQEVFFRFTSFLVPSTIYRLDAKKRSQQIWAKTKIPIDLSRFEVKQVWYASKDQTRVPMFLVHSKTLKMEGNNPTLLKAYGGFNQLVTPSFSPQVAYWVEQGGVFATANLRGGGEFGEKWHEAGMLEKKQNVFDDFVAAAEWLIAHGYTRPSKLAITGASNGGLLVGAALTQRPDLFRAVICSYPLLDMIRYQKFLVGRLWIPEYGSSENPDQFRYLLAYSPYHNVKAGANYPAVLFVTGDSDTRVDPLHARKMTALLQSSTGSENPVMLLYDTKAGHSRISTPVSKRIEELTNEVSFLFWQLDALRP